MTASIFEGVLLSPASELLGRLCASLGAVWLSTSASGAAASYAVTAVPSSAHSGSGRALSSAVPSAMTAPTDQEGSAVPSSSTPRSSTDVVKATVEGDAALDALVEMLSTALLDVPSTLVSSAGQTSLDLLMDPLPSLAHSRIAFDVWLRFRCLLIQKLFSALHQGLMSRSGPLTEAHAKALALLYRRVLRLQAIVIHPVDAATPSPSSSSSSSISSSTPDAATSSTRDVTSPAGSADAPPPPPPVPPAHSAPPPPPPPPPTAPRAPQAPDQASEQATDLLPHAEMLAVVLILLERGVGDERHRLVARAAEVAAKVAEKKEEASPKTPKPLSNEKNKSEI